MMVKMALGKAASNNSNTFAKELLACLLEQAEFVMVLHHFLGHSPCQFFCSPFLSLMTFSSFFFFLNFI